VTYLTFNVTDMAPILILFI